MNPQNTTEQRTLPEEMDFDIIDADVPAVRTTARTGEFYFDLETIPDQERFDIFEEFLEPLPPMYNACPLDQCPEAGELLKGSKDQIEQTLLELSPPEEYLYLLAATEQEGKQRKNISDLIRAFERKFSEYEEAFKKRIKLLSLTPEFCSIAAFGWATDNNDVGSVVINDLQHEAEILAWIWECFLKADRIIGFNIINFDLPVIFARSIILGVEPSRPINLSPYDSNRDVLDLYLKRFGSRGNFGNGGPGGLKALCRLYGVESQNDGIDGGDVFELMQTSEGRHRVKQYVGWDVDDLRNLCRRWRGVFV